MATMDAIVHHGGRPANFLDVGGGATPEKIANAFRIVMKDPNVRVILVNIFAGINRCDWIAQGVVQATRDQSIEVPVIVRLAGTNVDEGRAILVESGLDLIQAEDLDDAAAKAVAATDAVVGTTRPGRGKHERLRRPRLPGHHPGLHRPARHLPRRGVDPVRHEGRRGRHPRAGRGHASRPAGVQQRRGGGPRDGRHRERDLRARADRGGRSLRGDRVRHRGRGDHRRRRPGPGHGPHEALPGGQVHHDHRAELPRHHHARRVQGRHHAELASTRRAGSAWCRARARSTTRPSRR